MVEAEFPLMRRLSNDAPAFKIVSFPKGWGAFLHVSRVKELHSPSPAVPPTHGAEATTCGSYKTAVDSAPFLRSLSRQSAKTLGAQGSTLAALSTFRQR